MIFERYLLQNNLLSDSKTLLDQYSASGTLSLLQKDSINYYFGKTYYILDKPDTAAYFFSKVSKKSELYAESVFTKTYLCLNDADTSSLLCTLNSIQSDRPLTNELRSFTKASLFLYLRDTLNFNNCKSTFSDSVKDLTEFENKLVSIKNTIPKYDKSGFVAGALSAMVPGLGKIYSGKPKQGITTFLPVVLLGLQAFEAYSKGGIKSPCFIFDSGLLQFFIL